MRKGQNPLKYNAEPLEYKNHRIVIPIYIPNQEGYYKDLTKILAVSLDSLFQTIDLDKTNVTLISNGCCREALEIIQKYVDEGKVDRFLLCSENRGKLESVLSVTRGCHEDFITVSDADIFYYKGWLKETMDIFNTFPKAGTVSNLPTPHLLYTDNFSTHFDNLFRAKKGHVLKEEDIRTIYSSFGKSDAPHAEKYYKAKQKYIEKNGVKAIITTAHPSATYRREVFQYNPLERPKYLFNKKYKADRRFLDIPGDGMGFWRLATPRPMVYHLGNVYSQETAEQLRQTNAKNDKVNDSAGFEASPPSASISRIIPLELKRLLLGLFKKMNI